MYQQDNGKQHFFILDAEGNPDLLMYRQYVFAREGKQLVGEDKHYQKQLANYFDGWENSITELKDLSYEQKYLQKAFESYYESQGQSTDYMYQQEKVTSDFVALAGLSSSSLLVSENGVDYDDNTGSMKACAGIALDLYFPGTRKKLSLYNELHFTSYEFENEGRIVRGDDWYTDLSGDDRIQLSTIKHPHSLYYSCKSILILY